MDPMKSTRIWITRFVNPSRLGYNLPNLNEGRLGNVFRSISGLRGCDGRDMLAQLYRSTDWLRGELIDLGASLALRDEVFCESQSPAAWTIIRAAKLTYADYLGQPSKEVYVPVSKPAHGEVVAADPVVVADPVVAVETAEVVEAPKPARKPRKPKVSEEERLEGVSNLMTL